MFTTTITPRFAETDALGHINNTVIPVWFESGRSDIFKIFNPTQDLTHWNLIIAKIEVNYLSQTSYPTPVEIRTHISKVGNSSFTVFQEVFQGSPSSKRVAWGECIMVKFDYQTQKSVALTEQEAVDLNHHLVNKENVLN